MVAVGLLSNCISAVVAPDAHRSLFTYWAISAEMGSGYGWPRVSSEPPHVLVAVDDGQMPDTIQQAVENG